MIDQEAQPWACSEIGIRQAHPDGQHRIAREPRPLCRASFRIEWDGS